MSVLGDHVIFVGVGTEKFPPAFFAREHIRCRLWLVNTLMTSKILLKSESFATDMTGNMCPRLTTNICKIYRKTKMYLFVKNLVTMVITWYDEYAKYLTMELFKKKNTRNLENCTEKILTKPRKKNINQL